MEKLKVTDKRITTDLTVSPEIENSSPLTIFQAATQKGYDPEFISKMMDLQERHEANEAKKAFFEAVAQFKENPPEVLKDKINNHFNSAYTSLGNLLKTVNPALGKYGLSVSFSIDQQTDKAITVTCKLSHKQGHSDLVSMTAPPDTSGGNSKNPIQQIKSTITYLRAATFEAVTGIAATDANLDDDGNGAGVKYITDEQALELDKLLRDSEADPVKFLVYYDADRVQDIKASSYEDAKRFLKAKMANKDKKNKNEDNN